LFRCKTRTRGDPSGEFVVEFLTINYDKSGKPIKKSEELIGEFRTKNKAGLITKIENYMLEI
jgi:hypothetical protein